MGKVWEWITGGVGILTDAIGRLIGTWVGKALSFFGLTLVSFDVLLPQLKAFVLQFASGLPADALNFMGAIGIGQAMSMVFSALVVVYTGRVTLMRKTHAQALGVGGDAP